MNPTTLLTQIATNIKNMEDAMVLANQTQLWEETYRSIVTLIELIMIEDEGGDALLQQWLVDNRGFILFEGDPESRPDVVIPYNGTLFSFSVGSVYCTSPGEAGYFVTKGDELNIPFKLVSIFEWLEDGQVSFYFE